MFNKTSFLLIAITFVCALFVVTVRHQNRVEFVHLQSLEKHRDNLQAQWGRLMLEKGTWAIEHNIAEDAGDRLGMHPPPPEKNYYSQFGGLAIVARRVASKAPPVWRQHFVLSCIVAVFAILSIQVVHLQTKESDRLQAQGDKRYLRELKILPERGSILDRNGQALAVSTPVDSLTADPGVFCESQIQMGGVI